MVQNRNNNDHYGPKQNKHQAILLGVYYLVEDLGFAPAVLDRI